MPDKIRQCQLITIDVRYQIEIIKSNNKQMNISLLLAITLTLYYSTTSINSQPLTPQTIKIDLQRGKNIYKELDRYFTSSQTVSITDMISSINNKPYHFCYIQASTNSQIQLISKLYLDTINIQHNQNGKSIINQNTKNHTVNDKVNYHNPNRLNQQQGRIFYDLNEIIKQQNIITTYYHHNTIISQNSITNRGQNMNILLLLTPTYIMSVHIQQFTQTQQQNNQTTSKHNNDKSLNKQRQAYRIKKVIKQQLSKPITKAEFIHINNNNNNNGNNNNNSNNQQKDKIDRGLIMMMTEHQLYKMDLNNLLQSSDNIILQFVGTVHKQREDNKQQQQQQQEQFIRYIDIESQDILVLFTNHYHNVYQYNYKNHTFTSYQISQQYSNTLQQQNKQSITQSSQGQSTFTKLKQQQSTNNTTTLYKLLSSNHSQQILIINNKNNNNNTQQVILSKSQSNDLLIIYTTHSQIKQFIASISKSQAYQSNIINQYSLTNTQKCKQIYKFKQQLIFLQCKNHLLYFSIQDIIKCNNHNIDQSSSTIQSCINNIKPSHINVGYHIISIDLNQQTNYLTITGAEKYQIFYIDYNHKYWKINSIQNAATYYFNQYNIKHVYLVDYYHSVIVNNYYVAIVKQQQQNKEVYCKTVDQHSHNTLSQPNGSFNGTLIIQGVCQSSLQQSVNNTYYQQIQNSTYCRYHIPILVNVTQVVKTYQSLWYILLGVGLLIAVGAAVYFTIKRRTINKIYKTLEQEKQHGQQVVQHTVLTETNQPHEQTFGVEPQK